MYLNADRNKVTTFTGIESGFMEEGKRQ